MLLHFDGSGWSRVALARKLGAPVAIVPDDNGGVWIPVATGFPGNGSIVHFQHGRLTSAKLPIGPGRLLLLGASAGWNSVAVLAVGFRRSPVTHVAGAAVILRYGHGRRRYPSVRLGF